VGCGALLASFTPSGIRIEPPLVPLASKHGELITFGLPPSTMSGGRASGRGGTTWPLRRLPFVVYCPNRGRCGHLQHVE
jgi:hypothetical protein